MFPFAFYAILLNLLSNSFCFVPVQDLVPIKSNDLIVKTNDGLLKGKVKYAREGKLFYAFHGIPYAKPPVGKLRFKAPVPPKPWLLLRDATVEGPSCIQIDYLFKKHAQVEGSEDCLYLNVYTPTVSSKLKPEKEAFLPVTVYIHGGGFISGSSDSGIVGPEYILQQDVVLVTFNYRLGVFGFLSTSDDASPGNWGLKDQIAALKWVQKNIELFGGDRNRVTIFGTGAGAASVHYHMMHPEAPELFHKALSISGSALSLWARPQNKLLAQVARLQAKFVGCDPDSSSHKLVECLRETDARVLAESRNKFRYFDVEPLFIYSPAVEKLTPDNHYPYLTADPRDLILEGKFHRVPWLIGINQDEGQFRTYALLRQKKTRHILGEHYDLFGPNMFYVSASAEDDEEELWYAMKRRFLESDTFDVEDPDWVKKFIDMYGDRHFVRGVYDSVLSHAFRNHHPIWVYNFDYKGQYSYSDVYSLTKEDIEYNWGVGHGDNLIYLFHSPKLFPHLLWNEDDLIVSKIIIEFLVNFATHGDPTPYKYDRWRAMPDLSHRRYVDNSDLLYLNITNGHKKIPVVLKHESGLFPERMWKWDSLHLSESIPFILS